MRSVVISLFLFALLVFLTAVNVKFIGDSEKYIVSLAEEMANESGREDALSSLEDFWNRRKDIIGLTVSYTQLDRMSEMLVCARCAYDAKNEHEFQKYRALIIDAAEGISRTEKFSIGNIL